MYVDTGPNDDAATWARNTLPHAAFDASRDAPAPMG
jgi:hypothetical protein